MELYDLAERARLDSYAPYSNISVGCALLASSGKIYTGANVENASYSMTVCAERSAFIKAVNAGERKFVKIAIAGGRASEKSTGDFYPCGACIQVMREFCDGELEIWLSQEKMLTLKELSPIGFGKEHIK